jgi:hypothetical protein
MPISRKRKGTTRHRRNLFQGPLPIGQLFDRTVQKYYDVPAPPILYHYTTWMGTSGILSEQQFWATAHDCTNDPAELISADSIFLEALRSERKHATGAAVQALDYLLDGYQSLQVGRVLTACLACFSAARDDVPQRRKYAEEGRGLCLGVQILDEAFPRDRRQPLVKVLYSESLWRKNVTKALREICSLLSRADACRENVATGFKALYRIATHAAISAKKPEWEVEQEYRLVRLVDQNERHELKKRESAGKTIRYLPLFVRTGGKRIALSEITIGPNQTAEEAREGLTGLLARSNYRPDCPEYPKIRVSEVSPWNRQK